MNHPRYHRTVEELRAVASMWWPRELSEKEAELSVLPKLLETQDQFISILSVRFSSIADLFRMMEMAELSGNLLLKHLVVLADFGGEQLMRVNRHFNDFFPPNDEGNRTLRYLYGDKRHSYTFRELPIPGSLSNDRLNITGRKLLDRHPFTDLMRDVAMLLLFGSSAEDEAVAERLDRCEIGNTLGHPEKLAKFVKQRYLWVSRVTGGARANALGQAAQKYVEAYLREHLGVPGVEITSNGTLPGVYEREENRPSKFDIVVAKGERHVGVEVSFQVTTNSVIERKAGQARGRFDQIEARGYRVAYVLDGAGNFERENALRAICEHSHCTVAFSPAELDLLCEFLRNYLQGSDR